MMRFVQLKTPQQQMTLAVHRLREGYKKPSHDAQMSLL